MKIRKRLIVLKKFQTWFLLNFIFYGLISLSCVALGAYLWIEIVAKEILQLAGLLNDPLMSLLKLNPQFGIGIFAALCATLLALSVLQAFIFSRKIAGPLFALNKHLEKCERHGRFEKLNLRKGDLFVDIATTFNRAVDNINSEASERQPVRMARKRVAGLVRFGRG